MFYKYGPRFVNMTLICPKHYSKKVQTMKKDFFSFFHFFTFLHVTLKLAYFAPLNGEGQIFPVNFDYPRCLENSNMINFWLTSWVPLWWQIFLVFFFLFLPVTLNLASPKDPRIVPYPLATLKCSFALTSWTCADFFKTE